MIVTNGRTSESDTSAARRAETQTIVFEKANIVTSLRGRDEGKLFLVVATEDDYSLIADGKSRRIEKPKRKKNKHLQLEDNSDNNISAKLNEGERVTNNDIRRALAQFAEVRGEKGGM